ncbi:hypothetical protein M7I_0691 [Glarea lozoyensis 74030]|uniref:Uncharacterized protein n=1 Tax=Glarea lozoyensis (strain ATCC 74030 / MF5533) TaxID=1104152 RepID=H0EE23_GLAL7|nr:hypothetical protein M7I_0691 [Glarea lozoyensis 74030]
MAPINNSAKALQQNRPRPAVPKAIVPAIPLTYVQKRQKQQAARAKIEREEAPPASPIVAESPAPTSPISETVVVNGSSTLEKDEPTQAEQTEENESEPEAQAEAVPEPEPEVEAQPELDTSVESAGSVAEEVVESTDTPAVDEEPPDTQETPRSAPSEALSSTSRSTYQLPPPADNYARRQMGHFAPPEGYSPSATPMGPENYRYPPFDPSTPHSFHGSQSSAPNEHDNGSAFYHQYSNSTAVVNGSNGHINEVQVFQQPRHKSRHAPQAGPPISSGFHPAHMAPPPPMPEERYDGLVQYLQNQFADPAFADYTLELRYSDDRAPAVRIPGHNIIFARSPTLKSLMVSQQKEANGDAISAKTLFIESDDRFLRSDAFWLAMQRLYGGPLLDLNHISALNGAPSTQTNSPALETFSDRFDLALGYAAAGHILQIPPAVNRGIEIAAQSICWNTLERAFDFALDGGLDCSWTLQPAAEQGRSPSTYGPTVNLLLQSALNWTITNFPPTFELDKSVGDFTHNRRLPEVPPDDRPKTHNPRLSSIKFGDHASDESPRYTTNGDENTILSKLLLNLPYFLLKYVLESSRLGNVQGWATSALRQKTMRAVVNEREMRRLKVKSNLNVANSERKKNHESWEAVAWIESIEPPASPEGSPTIARSFNDYLEPKTAN